MAKTLPLSTRSSKGLIGIGALELVVICGVGLGYHKGNSPAKDNADRRKHEHVIRVYVNLSSLHLIVVHHFVVKSVKTLFQ
jgi:hypothetical protein